MATTRSTATFRQRVRYAVDNFLARGSLSLFVALTLAFVGAIVLLTLLRASIDAIFPDADQDLAHHAWVVFLELTDPGNMNQDNTTPTAFKLGAIAAGLTGVVIFSSLIAFLTTALDQAIHHLKKGHSVVLESGHTLILGWNPRVVEILRELAEAMASERDPVVVILAETPKEELDELLRTELGRAAGRMRVVTRTGPTSSIRSLELVNAREARSAIVLASCPPFAPEDEKLSSDARVIKTVLALCTHVGAREDLTVVAEVFEERNRKVVRDIAPENVVVLAVEEILAKIMVQTSRTSGLAVVYQELLGFAGCEIYFHRARWGRGLTFAALQYRWHDGVPIGVRTAEGEIRVRPPASYEMREGDAVIIVAEDDSTIALTEAPVIEPRALTPTGERVPRRREQLLVLGWSAKAPTILAEYAKYVETGSSVDVMVRELDDELRAQLDAIRAEVGERLTIAVAEGDPLDRAELEARRPFDYDNVIVLPQEHVGERAPERVDSESIVVLLHLRGIRRDAREAAAAKRTKIVTEVLESGNQELVSKAGVDDVIISNRMVSMIFAQLSEQREIHRVYDDLFEEEGSEIYVKPASLYFAELPADVRFGDLMAVAQARDGEVCIGVKKGGLESDARRNYGIRLIPKKDEVLRIERGDALVVVAEDET